MKKHLLLMGILMYTFPSFAQGLPSKIIVPIAKKLPQESAHAALQTIKFYRVAVFKNTNLLRHATVGADIPLSERPLKRLAHISALKTIPAPDLRTLGASILNTPDFRPPNKTLFRIPHDLTEKTSPLQKTDGVELVLNGETLPLNRTSGYEALQAAYLLKSTLEKSKLDLEQMTLEEYACFAVLEHRFQQAYTRFLNEGAWTVDETAPVVLDPRHFVFRETSAFTPSLNARAENINPITEAELTAELADSMADLMWFMARTSAADVFGAIFQIYPNTLFQMYKPKHMWGTPSGANKISNFIFQNAINKF